MIINMQLIFPITVFCYLLILSLQSQVDRTSYYKSTTADAATRAELTLNGLFHYFWKNDPNSKGIQFFFACGQIGGAGTQNNGQCSCENPTSCTNCYRWWDALAMESVANYGIYMKTKNNSDIVNIIYAHSPYNAKFDGTNFCTYVDDFVWYAMAYLRFYEWLGVYITIERVYRTIPPIHLPSHIILYCKPPYVCCLSFFIPLISPPPRCFCRY